MPRLIELSAAGKGPSCAKLVPVAATPHAASRAIPSGALDPPKAPRVCARAPCRSRVTGVVLSFRTHFCLPLLPILVQPARRDAAALSPSPGPSTSPPVHSLALSPASDTAHRHRCVPSPVPSPASATAHRPRRVPSRVPTPRRAVPRGSRAAGGAKASRVCSERLCKALQVSQQLFTFIFFFPLLFISFQQRLTSGGLVWLDARV